MESFGLLRYCRCGTGGSSLAANMLAAKAMTLLEPVVDDEETDDEGPLFDFEFATSDDIQTISTSDDIFFKESSHRWNRAP
ncbi:hypothetical protein MA16_Dca013572 [Dendrobium catenatum]|uniref:Uncharacterized protein n=1 Tax=Dendrobium catenatum TaxID=906689 RepID=A0A2I0VPU5_9ASPA|nr:hypothetical protein MA16_Dca013572 [Dendrobium catenatum]